MPPDDNPELHDRIRITARRRRCLAILVTVIPLGLVWRLAPLHLPPFAFKYGGSMLWAAAVYWVLAAALPRWRPVPLAVLAAALATGVELLKLVYWPPLDHFRETLAGKLLLGRYFSFGALAAYGLAIGCTCVLELSREQLSAAPSTAPSTARST